MQWTGRTMPSGGQQETFGWTRQGELSTNKQKNKTKTIEEKESYNIIKVDIGPVQRERRHSDPFHANAQDPQVRQVFQ